MVIGGKIKELLGNNKLVIWGTGNNAVACTTILRKFDIEVYAYCDSNEMRWGMYYKDKMIMSPKELFKLCSQEHFTLVIASMFYEEIEKQVKSFLLHKIILFQEIYMLNACYELARKYDLSEKRLLQIVENNYDKTCDIFMDDRFHVDKLELELDKILPELRQKYRLSICVIVKNEADYIIEWIEYHRMVGVEHFYIYDNDSTDELKDIIKEYVKNGVVTYIPWSGMAQQLLAYSDAIKKYKNESKYIAFIDADEFLVPVIKEDLYKVIDEIFKEHILAGGIGVNWRVYGTSFHKEKISGLVIENFKYRAEDFNSKNIHIKTICNPRRVVDFTKNPHAANYKDKYYCISENGSFIPNAFFYDGMCKKIRINHYVTKSVSEYRERCLKGKADSDKKYTDGMIDARLQEAEKYNEIYDSIMDKYIEKLKEQLL